MIPIIILQARTSSKRLPGKVLKELQGIPMLSHSIRRLKRVERARLVVATSTMNKDDATDDHEGEDTQHTEDEQEESVGHGEEEITLATLEVLPR